jgi:hypothetical protein
MPGRAPSVGHLCYRASRHLVVRAVASKRSKKMGKHGMATASSARDRANHFFFFAGDKEKVGKNRGPLPNVLEMYLGRITVIESGGRWDRLLSRRIE